MGVAVALMVVQCYVHQIINSDFFSQEQAGRDRERRRSMRRWYLGSHIRPPKKNCPSLELRMFQEKKLTALRKRVCAEKGGLRNHFGGHLSKKRVPHRRVRPKIWFEKNMDVYRACYMLYIDLSLTLSCLYI